MKPLIVLLFAIATNSWNTDESAIRKRQNIGGTFVSLGNAGKQVPKSTANTINPSARTFPQAKRVQQIWGPFKLTPTDGDHSANAALKLDKQSDVFELALDGLCKDCMVLRGSTDITDRNGTKLTLKDDVYVHHIIVANMARGLNMVPLFPTKFSCTGPKTGKTGKTGGFGGVMGMSSPKSGKTASSSAMNGSPHSHGRRSPQPQSSSGFTNPMSLSIFIGKGNEGDYSMFSPLNTTAFKSGYWIGKNDKMTATAEVVNYKNVSREVYLSVDIEYVEFLEKPKDYYEVAFGSLQVDQCGSMMLYPPNDRPITYNSTEWTSMATGHIFGISPHLHDGASDAALHINDKVVCSTQAVYGQDGGTSVNGEKWETITSYTPCNEAIKVKIGDRLKLTSDYNLQKRKLRPDSAEHGMEAEAMAIITYQFAYTK